MIQGATAVSRVLTQWRHVLRFFFGAETASGAAASPAMSWA